MIRNALLFACTVAAGCLSPLSKVQALHTSVCRLPALTPRRVLFIRPPVYMNGKNPDVGDAAIAPKGDVLWSLQDLGHSVGALYLYSHVTHTISRLSSPNADTLRGLGRMGISANWIVFATISNPWATGDWNVVAHNRRTGAERVIMTAPAGGALGSGQVALDGDTAAWTQAEGQQLQVRTENLDTGVERIVASTPAFNNFYTWTRADGGHVVWEWMHLVNKKPVSDILEVAETGGPVLHVTTDGQAPQPSLSWPNVAYIPNPHFGHATTLAVKNLLTGTVRTFTAGSDVDDPELAGNLLMYNPGFPMPVYSSTAPKSTLPYGTLAWYNLQTGAQLFLHTVRQRSYHGHYLTYFRVAPGYMVALGGFPRSVGGSKVVMYVLEYFEVPSPASFASFVKCSG